MLDPLRTAIALVPLGIFLALWGVLHLRRRPWVLAGWRETAALGLACSGLVLVGPAELFLPYAAGVRFGPWVWLLLALLYLLSIVLLIQSQAPRLVLFDLETADAVALATRAAKQLDSDARWAGSTLWLPNHGLEVRLDGHAPLRSATLTARGLPPAEPSWRHFAQLLRQECQEARTGPGLTGIVLLAWGLGLLSLSARQLVHDPALVTQALVELLRL